MRRTHAAPWHAKLATIDPLAPADENLAIETTRLFTAYLQACREERYAMSLLPPGRFLMPGDLAGSPALTFAPLDLPGQIEPLTLRPGFTIKTFDNAAKKICLEHGDVP